MPFNGNVGLGPYSVCVYSPEARPERHASSHFLDTSHFWR